MMTGMGVGSVLMIIFWLFILVGSVWLLAKLFPAKLADPALSGRRQEKEALLILRQRYARGEITRQEFEDIRNDLEQA